MLLCTCVHYFTPIITNHELPHWFLPDRAYLPADHHHQYSSDFSSGYISPDNIVPQDLTNHHPVPPSIVPPPHHLYLDLELRGVNYSPVLIPHPALFSPGSYSSPEPLQSSLMFPPMSPDPKDAPQVTLIPELDHQIPVPVNSSEVDPSVLPNGITYQ